MRQTCRNPFSSDLLAAATPTTGCGRRARCPTSPAPTDEPLQLHDHPAIARQDRRAPRRRATRRSSTPSSCGCRGTTCERRADDVAAGLLALGLGRGNRVGIWAPNRARMARHAVRDRARSAPILVNINPAYRATELEYALNKVGCKALVMARRFKSSDYLGMLARRSRRRSTQGASEVLDSARLPELKHVVAARRRSRCRRAASSYRRLRRARRPGASRAARRADRGARSRRRDQHPVHQRHDRSPKGATLSHFNIVNNARYCAKAMALSADDRLCIPVPLYHCFGMVLGVLCCTARRRHHGVSRRRLRRRGDAARRSRATAARRCTACRRCSSPSSSMPNFAQLRPVVAAHRHHGGRAVPDRDHAPGDRAHAHARGHHRLRHDRDQPDLVPVALDDPLERRVSTVGRIQPHVEVKIVDARGPHRAASAARANSARAATA